MMLLLFEDDLKFLENVKIFNFMMEFLVFFIIKVDLIIL